MLSKDEIREVLPCPIRIEICGDEPFLCIRGLIKKLREKHNKIRDSKIENIIVDYVDEDFAPDLEYNQFKIFVGKNLIHEGIAPSLIEKNENQNKEFWTSFLSLVEGILNIWHDEIIKAQKDNDAKLKKIKEEGYDEFLFAYYYSNNDTKFFMYLKRLATRYPNSQYVKILRRVYRLGYRSFHKRKYGLWKKMDKSVNKAKLKDF
jgi:hypothetical protein